MPRRLPLPRPWPRLPPPARVPRRRPQGSSFALELPRELTGLTLRRAWPSVLNRMNVWNVLNGRLHFADRGAIAQLGERLDRTQEVAGSSPASSTLRGIARTAAGTR